MWSRSHVGGKSPELPELRLNDGATLGDFPVQQAWTSGEVASFRLLLPEPLVATYAYPLVVYVHDEQGSDADLENWFPAVSDQNFVAAAVRAPFPNHRGLPGRYSWCRATIDSVERLVAEACSCIGAIARIHPGRITLMGEGAGAAFALQAALTHPEQYSGAIVINPLDGLADAVEDCLPTASDPQPRVLLLRTQQVVSDVDQSLLRSLASRGLDVQTMLPFAESCKLSPERRVNRWLMSAIPTTIW